MSSIKPIKRSEQLAPLSREHHDGLLFVWKIRQGMKNDTGIDKLRSYALWYWKEHIKPHFYQEEKILLPFLPGDHPLVQQMKREHEQIRELVLTIDQEAEKELLVILCDLVDKHIRFEERQLFGFIEQLLTPPQLQEIHQQLEEFPASTLDWEDAFWVNKPL